MPVEQFKQYVEVRWYAEKSVPRFIVLLLAMVATTALEQDRPVWETKIWRKAPALVKGDGPFLDFFQWYNQFYSARSAEVGCQAFDW